ncbi:MAG: class I SAM-dependent methyltransferase [Candidatus Paceibacteria bacterium]
MFLSPAAAVDHLRLAPGVRVGDFGCGPGEHALLIARRLGARGAVYAFERHPDSVAALARRRASENLQNLFPLQTNLDSGIPLKDGLLDAALVSNTLHALQARERFVSELSRVLNHAGCVLVVDWAHSFGNMGPPEGAVVYPADAVRLFRAHGFTVGDMLPAGTHHFAFIAAKP